MLIGNKVSEFKPETSMQKYLPWHEKDQEFGVAITGKVLEYIKSKNKLFKHVLPQILKKT